MQVSEFREQPSLLNTVLIARVVHHKQFDPYPYIALNLMLSGLAGLQARSS